MTNMTRLKYMVGLAAISFILIILMITSPRPESRVIIEYVGNSNSVEGPLSILRLSNKGTTVVRINAYCTVSWTNCFDMETNYFYEHKLGFPILKSGQSIIITVPPPTDCRMWEPSLSYVTRPSRVKRIYDWIQFHFSGKWRPDNSSTIIIGPAITNTVI